MKLEEIARELGLETRAGEGCLDVEVGGGYVGDLISDVIANGSEAVLWVTHQTHQNTVAAAVLKGLAGIVVANGRAPEDDTLQKARVEGVPLLVSRLPAFEVAGRLYGLGLRGVTT